MEGEECFWITFVKGRGLELDLRQYVWHTLLTRLRQISPACEAWTGYEYVQQRGVHLNVVVKGVPGLTWEWAAHVATLVGDGTEVGDFQAVYDAGGLAHYLTKQFANREVMYGWPKYFRPVTVTRGWCPEWLCRKDYMDTVERFA